MWRHKIAFLQMSLTTFNHRTSGARLTVWKLVSSNKNAKQSASSPIFTFRDTLSNNNCYLPKQFYLQLYTSSIIYNNQGDSVISTLNSIVLLVTRVEAMLLTIRAYDVKFFRNFSWIYEFGRRDPNKLDIFLDRRKAYKIQAARWVIFSLLKVEQHLKIVVHST